MDYLNYLDHKIFEWIQVHMRNQSLDWWVTIWRDKYFWIPLYIFLISLLAFQYKQKFFIIFLFIIATITVSDQTSSQLLKKWIKRSRPCQEEYFKDHFTGTINCSGAFSMPSSHATNHMAVGLFLFFLLKNIIPRGRFGFLLWAISIGFAQIYVGVHFPGDVLAGLLLGSLIGALLYWSFVKIVLQRISST